MRGLVHAKTLKTIQCFSVCNIAHNFKGIKKHEWEKGKTKEDAIYVDTTEITAEEVADKIIQLVQERYR